MNVYVTLGFSQVYSGNYYLTSQNIAFEWKTSF